MSIVTDVRSYADGALAQGKSALNQAGTVVLSANKRLVTDAVKPAYAAVGAADLIAVSVTKGLESLPAGAIDNVARAQQTGRRQLARTRDDVRSRMVELRSRMDARAGSVATLPTAAKSVAGAYLKTVNEFYVKLSARGEAKTAELGKDSVLGRLIGLGDEVTASDDTASDDTAS